MKTILPWILVLALAAGAAAMYVSGSSKDAEIAKLREQAQQADAMRAELDQVKAQTATQEQQLTTLRKDNEELLKLRNEVRALRDDKQKISRDLQNAQATADRIQSQAEAARSSLEQRLQQTQQTQTQASALNTCINNLRQLDGAKQQWALENNKTAAATPTAQDLAPYLRGQLVCPAGGQYTIGIVSNAPTCSIPGHTLQ